MLTKKDFDQIKTKGISNELVEKQIKQFNTGFPYSNLQKAATPGDGIIASSDDDRYISIYNKAIKNGMDTLKFVPASGAATRMFKALFEFIHSSESKAAELANEEPYREFFERFDDFAFASDLKHVLSKDDISTKSNKEIISALLLEHGLNYGKLPKGLLKFHSQNNVVDTPVEEHLKEAALYACSKGTGRVHFTVSPEHHDLFKKQIASSQARIEQRYNIKFDVEFSFQKQSTDTIAVNPDNTPFRQADDSLLFRPAGHGALIENLNDLNAELIFVKNIDNVIPEYRLSDTVHYKKLLAGVLLDKKEKVFTILNGLDDENAQKEAIKTGLTFVSEELQINVNAVNNMPDAEKLSFIKNKLNRPIRICGMVKNEGEPGGGPFWVKQSDGSTSLQIVEGAQIDPNDKAQQEILNASTHFNPVDLVCYIKDYEGNKFDLNKFVDPETGFISNKTQGGKPLKALELPGLWNGAMANWLTFFVEVPVSTFNPVKTVMDLLRPQHQPE